MGRAVILKTIGIGTLALLLMIPVLMIRDLIGERQARRNDAVREIAEGWGGHQVLSGPYVVVSYRRTWSEVETEKVDGREKQRRIERTESGLLRLPADSVTWRVDAATTEKARGVHRARLYGAKIRAEGSITIPPNYGVSDGDSRYEWFAPRLVLGVQDPRGIRSLSALEFGAQSVEFVPGATDRIVASGVHAQLESLLAVQPRSHAFRFALDLAGAESFGMVPLANETALAFASDWPHPSFQGQFLPASHEIGGAGFVAHWKVSRYAAQGAERLRACNAAAECRLANGERMVVSFVEPVGVYQLLDRASKYGFLFIGLVFASFFLFELVRRLAIHPVQYALVGLALAMFFLLLTALSEHVPFWIAYFAGAVACVGLVASYVARVVRSARTGAAFGAALAALYGALYLLLKAEDYALLAGSLLLFVMLTGLMVGTRRIDWYQLTQARPATAPAPAPPA